jgi:hypothetical protein
MNNVDILLKAINNLFSGKWETCSDSIESIQWKEGFVLNDQVIQEISSEVERLQAEYDAIKYQRDRAPEYPPIGDQLDALWKGGEDAQEMLAKVQAVKAKYPKPE